MARKRTSIYVPPRIKIADVSPMSFDDMVIRDKSGKAYYFKRLRYRDVPTLHQITTSPELLISASRDKQIREIFNLAKNDQHAFLPLIKNGAVPYIRYLDKIPYSGDLFDFDIMSQCLKHFNNLALKGEQRYTATQIQNFLSIVLRKVGRVTDLRKLPKVKKANTKGGYSALEVETELKVIAKVLRTGFLSFVKHIKAETMPDTHPLYNETIFNETAKKMGWSIKQKSDKKMGFRNSLILVNTKILSYATSPLSEDKLKYRLLANQASRCALYTFYMLTGMNPSVLAPIRFSDVEFKDINGGRYIFNGEKARAWHKQIDNSLGFSKKTKELIESWIDVSKLIYKNMDHQPTPDSPLIPNFNTQGEVLDYSMHGTNPSYINKTIESIVGFKVNSTRFRKTKSDILMRVTEDIFLVSQGLNNSIKVIQSTYSSGTKDQHNKNIKATTEAMFSVAKGQEISEAVQSAKLLNCDILSDYEYRERLKRNEIPPTTLTPSGIRCKGASAEKLSAELKKSDKMGTTLPKGEGNCTDFLYCYDCDSHVLVASENDIWLMLSFQFQIIEMKEITARNSKPKRRLFEIEILLAKTLSRMQEKAPDAFSKARNKIEEDGYHPLYQSRHSLKYFLGSKNA